ncbi:hypothetical protein BZG36_03903 [Bifiguratus adelaidae]|uniref:Btz domain-containing protein n=1 Tax=Bifiguratus adelaidae TaxID=1938954 RepID=A0A261XXI7_9FUNG|nr:hypothetical protein BZG36_03903 [Bifiguratus adelaidae]
MVLSGSEVGSESSVEEQSDIGSHLSVESSSDSELEESGQAPDHVAAANATGGDNTDNASLDHKAPEQAQGTDTAGRVEETSIMNDSRESAKSNAQIHGGRDKKGAKSAVRSRKQPNGMSKAATRPEAASSGKKTSQGIKKSTQEPKSVEHSQMVTVAEQMQDLSVEATDQSAEETNDSSVAQETKDSVRGLTSFEKRAAERREYRRKLVEDPSFVPHLGEFWGHDDRFRSAGLKNKSRRGGFRGRGRGMRRPYGPVRDYVADDRPSRADEDVGLSDNEAIPRKEERSLSDDSQSKAGNDAVESNNSEPITGSTKNGRSNTRNNRKEHSADIRSSFAQDGRWTHDGFNELLQMEEEEKQQNRDRKPNDTSRGGRIPRGRARPYFPKGLKAFENHDGASVNEQESSPGTQTPEKKEASTVDQTAHFAAAEQKAQIPSRRSSAMDNKGVSRLLTQAFSPGKRASGSDDSLEPIRPRGYLRNKEGTPATVPYMPSSGSHYGQMQQPFYHVPDQLRQQPLSFGQIPVSNAALPGATYHSTDTANHGSQNNLRASNHVSSDQSFTSQAYGKTLETQSSNQNQTSTHTPDNLQSSKADPRNFYTMVPGIAGPRADVVGYAPSSQVGNGKAASLGRGKGSGTYGTYTSNGLFVPVSDQPTNKPNTHRFKSANFHRRHPQYSNPNDLGTEGFPSGMETNGMVYYGYDPTQMYYYYPTQQTGTVVTNGAVPMTYTGVAPYVGASDPARPWKHQEGYVVPEQVMGQYMYYPQFYQ